MKTVRPLGLYIHIPFCKAKCVYCDFYSLPHGEDRMDAIPTPLRPFDRSRAAGRVSHSGYRILRRRHSQLFRRKAPVQNFKGH